MTTVFLNNQFIPENEARIPIEDRGFLFGDGVFTTIKVSNRNIELLDEHLERLRLQCQELHIIPPDIDKQWFQELIRLNEAFSGTWKLKIVITGGNEKALALPERSHGCLLITLEPYEVSEASVRLTVFPMPIVRPLSKLKSLSYLDRLCVADYAKNAGFDDALVLSPEGFVLETAFSNVFWRHAGRVYAPDPALPFLEGVTCQHYFKSLEQPVGYAKMCLDEMPGDAEFYSCNALKGIVRATLIS